MMSCVSCQPWCSTHTDRQPPAPCTTLAPPPLPHTCCCRGLANNNLVGLVPALPFAKFTDYCCLQGYYHTNNFTCPLPPVRARRCSLVQHP